jgi:hypothetical protein
MLTVDVLPSTENAEQFSPFFEKALLKKIYAIKDTFVQRSFYKFLGSIARTVPSWKLSSLTNL